MLLTFPLRSEKIYEFFEFANNVHKMTECNDTDCDIFNFLKPLKETLLDETCPHHQKIPFMNQCMEYTNVFNAILQLIKESVKTTVEYLRRKNFEQLQDKINKDFINKGLFSEQLCVK